MSRYSLVKQFLAKEAEEKRVIDNNELLRIRGERNLAVRSPRPDSDGFMTGLDAQEVEFSSEDEGNSGNVIKANEDARVILEQAQGEAQAILEQARREAQQIRQEAVVQAESEKENIFEQAQKQGYDAGMAKTQSEAEALKREYHEKETQLEAAYQQRFDELEPQLVDTITAIYEHIFQVELGSQREILEHLISNTVHKLEGGRSFLIHVSREDYSHVNMHKKQILNGAVSGTDTVDVVEDATLGKNQCMIETDSGIFDCGLDTHLSELRQKLMLISWSKEE